MSVFALTAFLADAFFLKRWIDYYAPQLGAENLFVIDFSKADSPMTLDGPISYIRVPGNGEQVAERAKFIQGFRRSLLKYYGSGFACDPDEFIVADPRKYKNLKEFARLADTGSTRCLGLELIHVREREPDFRSYLPILAQRRYAVFRPWLCKQAFTRVSDGGGFSLLDKKAAPSNAPDHELLLINAANFDFAYRDVRLGAVDETDSAQSGEISAKARKRPLDSYFMQAERCLADGQVSTDLASLASRFDEAEPSPHPTQSEWGRVIPELVQIPEPFFGAF